LGRLLKAHPPYVHFRPLSLAVAGMVQTPLAPADDTAFTRPLSITARYLKSSGNAVLFFGMGSMIGKARLALN
jgi:hypothetical protein